MHFLTGLKLRSATKERYTDRDMKKDMLFTS